MMVMTMSMSMSMLTVRMMILMETRIVLDAPNRPSQDKNVTNREFNRPL